MTTIYDDPRLKLARGALGGVRVVHDPALPPRVLRLVNADCDEFFAKQHSERDR